jgi:hypothetical protein
MGKNKNIIIGVVVLIIAAIVAYLLMSKNAGGKTTTTTTASGLHGLDLGGLFGSLMNTGTAETGTSDTGSGDPEYDAEMDPETWRSGAKSNLIVIKSAIG